MVSYGNFVFPPNFINFMKTFREKKESGKFEKMSWTELNFRMLQKECES